MPDTGPSKLYLHEVEFYATEVLEVMDLVSNTWIDILGQAKDLGCLSEDDWLDALRAGCNRRHGDQMAIACAALAANGYDALSYKNTIEDPGSVSWIILRPELVDIVDISAYMQGDVAEAGYGMAPK